MEAGARPPGRIGRVLLLGGAAIVLIVVALLLIGRGGGSDAHRVSVIVDDATNVVTGQSVRQSGVPVGRVSGFTPIEGGRTAQIDIELDEVAWPLPADSTMALRWGGTANFNNRYIALERGDERSKTIPEGGTVRSKAFTGTVEFDELLGTFNERTRADVHRLLDASGPAMAAARDAFRETLDVGPPALREGRFVLDDLDAEQEALTALVDSTDRILGAVDSSEPGVREVVTGAAQTFDAIAAVEGSLGEALDRAPPTLARTRTTLARADGTLEAAARLTRNIAPGVAEVRKIARPLDGVLETVDAVGPDAEVTLSTVTRSAPDLNPLLERATEISPQLESIGRQAIDNLHCIRPYTPDAVAFFSNWGDFFSVPDEKDKIIRAQVQTFLPAQSNASPLNSAQAKKLYPGLEFGFPRPPGTNAGQPWFLPECGAGPDALDPAKDPETRGPGATRKAPPLDPIGDPAKRTAR